MGNNPVNYVDPTGHEQELPKGYESVCTSCYNDRETYDNPLDFVKVAADVMSETINGAAEDHPILATGAAIACPESGIAMTLADMEQNGLKLEDLLVLLPVGRAETGVTEALGASGRARKQKRLLELLTDALQPSHVRGWIQQEVNENKGYLRNPPGYELAHRRGFEAREGYGYEYSDLQTTANHRLQHQYEGYK